MRGDLSESSFIHKGRPPAGAEFATTSRRTPYHFRAKSNMPDRSSMAGMLSGT